MNRTEVVYIYLRIFAITGFLILLGLHLFDYTPFAFVAASLFLIDWREVWTKETGIVILFLLSVYVTWFFLDHHIIENQWCIGHGILLFSGYALGLSINVPYLKDTPYEEKIIFYLLFGFFFAYMVSLLYSYITLPSASALNREGMYVFFQNEYKRLHINDGNLISTIIAYYLSFSVVLLPLVLFHFKMLLSKKFHIVELFLFILNALFALYLANAMQRRIVVLLLIVVFCYFAVLLLLNHLRSMSLRKLFSTLLIIVFSLSAGYYLMHDSEAVKRLVSTDLLHVRRFGFWLPGLQAMLDHPWGGGHGVFVGHNMRLAHNTWIDIGKDFGLIPFILSIILFGVHSVKLFQIISNRNVDRIYKDIFIIIFLCFFVIMMIEPVFTSDKTFIFYLMFYFGFLNRFHQSKQ
jgi:hypothetical protein